MKLNARIVLVFTALLTACAAKEAVDAPAIVEAPRLDKALFESKPASEAADAKKFSAEVARLLKIFGTNVYKDRKAVIRELLSNAIDAIEKQHETALASGPNAEGALSTLDQYRVVIEADPEAGLLAITDNGVGMTGEELEKFLGTIAMSGSAKHVDAKMKKGESASNIIGQFGVGFYSFLLIADRAVVVSKADGDPVQHVWEADSSASFRVYADPAGNTLGRGTRIVLQIREDAREEFLDADHLQVMAAEYFSHDPHRIYVVKPKTVTEKVPVAATDDSAKAEDDVRVEDEDVQGEEKEVTRTVYERVLVSRSIKPIWKRKPADVAEDEYASLYKTLASGDSGATDGFIAKTHFTGETQRGEAFSAVLYIPERPPFAPFAAASDAAKNASGVKLHVRGVYVTARPEDDFIPRNLSFVRGIIDSDELSLNISRDILQNSAELRGIRKKVMRKVIEMMNDLATEAEAHAADGDEHEAVKRFTRFYDAYSAFIKLELAENEDLRALLAPVLRFRTTRTPKTVTKSKDTLFGDFGSAVSVSRMRSLAQYVADAGEAQRAKKVIYYLAGTPSEIDRSPLLARFAERGIEVVLLTEPVDEHMVQRMTNYDGDWRFESIAKDGVVLDDAEAEATKAFDETYAAAKTFVAKALKADIERVVLVGGPEAVPGTVKSTQYGWTGNMERLILAQSSTREDPMLAFMAKQKRILELNPRNALVRDLLERAGDPERANAELKVALRVLADSFAISSGFAVRDPARFSAGIERVLRRLSDVPVAPLGSKKAKDATEASDAVEDTPEDILGVNDEDDDEKAEDTFSNFAGLSEDGSSIDKESLFAELDKVVAKAAADSEGSVADNAESFSVNSQDGASAEASTNEAVNESASNEAGSRDEL